MDGPVTLMMQNTLLVKKDQAGNQDAKKKRMPKVVRASARKRWAIVRVGRSLGMGRKGRKWRGMGVEEERD